MTQSSALTLADELRLLRLLSKSPIFALTCHHDLARLVAGAARVSAKAGEVICAKDAVADALLLLVEGEFGMDGAARLDLGGAGGPILGIEAAVRGGKYPMSIVARTDASYFAIPVATIQAVYASSPPFRAAVRPRFEKIDANIVSDPGNRGAVVRFKSQLPSAPLPLLVKLLAEETATSFPERLIIVHDKGAAASASTPQQVPLGGPGQLFRVHADAQWIETHRAAYDYLLLDPEAAGLASSVTPDIVVELLPSGAPVTSPDTELPWVLQTMVVEPAPPPPSRTLTLIDANPPSPRRSVDACRVHLDFSALRGLQAGANGQVPLSALDAGTRRSLGIWSRALTRRRTGLAIAGGGVFSMQGVYVLQQILERGVPVDVITGASAGSLVGGYYAALGPAGLDKLVRQGDCGGLDAMVLGGIFCGALMEAYVACSLGKQAIERLPHAHFFPAASNLSTGEGVVAVTGPLALGIRASSSAPPLFPATITSRQRLVDGGFSNNTPVQALQLFNADLTFGLNSYPPARFGVNACVPECVAQTLATVGLLNRALTFVTAFSLSISIGGSVQGDMAHFGYNAESSFPAPYLLVADFTRTSDVIAAAAQSEQLEEAICAFVSRWEAIRDRRGLVEAAQLTPPR
jgi:NTE family protein